MMSPTSARPINGLRPARRGFSFAEVLFAVVILGIGFIMVAAIFPVAIQQNQATGEQANAAAFARVSASVLAQVRGFNAGMDGYNVTPSQALPVVGTPTPTYVFPFDTATITGTPPVMPTATVPYQHGSFMAVAGSLISPTDPRFAVVPLYSLSQGSGVAQLYFFNVAVRNQSVYTATDIKPNPTPTTAAAASVQCTLVPKLVRATIVAGAPSLVTFTSGSGNPSPAWTLPTTSVQPTYADHGADAAGTGCYVLVGNDGLANNATFAANAGLFNGKVYKVGNPRPDLGATVWELVPGNDFVPQTVAAGTITTLTNADVWIVGKGLQDHGNPYTAGTNVYTDAAQDVSFYTTFAPIQ